MSYNPTIAECRAALVQAMQLSMATDQYNNAEGAGNVLSGYAYDLSANLTTALTNGCIKGKAINYVSFIDPIAANITANIGDTCDVLTVDSSVSTTAPTTAARWMYTGFGWQKVVLGGPADLTSLVGTTAATLNNMWWANSATTGTIRTLSLRQNMTGTGTEDGETLRCYNLISGTITGSGVHGAHITAQLGSETLASTGACTGEAAGVRATIGIGLTNTAANLGTIAALRVDSYFLSAATNAASSLIYGCDVGGTYGVDAILRLGTMVNRSTTASALGAYSFVTGGLTAAATAAKVAFKVVTPDGTFFILGWAQGNITAT